MNNSTVGSADDCEFCIASPFDAPICGSETELPGHVRVVCTRVPNHGGKHVACGAHHDIFRWPWTVKELQSSGEKA